MIIKDEMCYSKLLWLLYNIEFMSAINKTTFKRPQWEFEGMAGYIKVEVEFDVKDILIFASETSKWWLLTDEERLNMYKYAKGLPKCR